MIHVSDSVCIDAPAAEVWYWLAQLEAIALWSENVQTATCAPGRDAGVGAERLCTLGGGITLVETWTNWDEGRSFTYEGRGLPGVKIARNTWTVESHGPRQTLLRTEASVQLRAGRLGDLAAPMVRWQSRRMGWRALAAFKHLVETGGAPMVAHALLDRPPALC
ncbi:MAG: SRPBCC family protein [Acidimicrobiales bacterium]